MTMNRSMHPPPNLGDASTSGSSLNDLGTTLAAADWSTIIAFGSIPVVAALIGYGTNILAIQMTFLPLEYIGFWEAGFRQCGFSFGWQGIIPANAAKIANITIDLVTRDILKVDEVFGRIDPQKIVEATRVPLHRALERILEQLGAKHAPDVWTSLSLTAKAELAEQAAEMAEPYVVAMVVEMRGEIHELLDLHALCVGKLLEDKSLMNEIFRRCGEEEFRFIELSGLYFGFLLGLCQAAIWWALLQLRASLVDPTALPLTWFLPVAGALNGYVTNALALGVIFNPIEPKKICGFVFLGLFLQRQKEVSKAFALLVAARIVTAAHCWEHILFSEHGRHKFTRIVTRVTERAIDEHVDSIRPLLPLIVGSDTFLSVRREAAELLLQELPGCLRSTYAYTEQAMDIENLLATRMSRLKPSQFERLLHPAFEEDEWKLIGIGGLLGLVVGVFQLVFVFSDQV